MENRSDEKNFSLVSHAPNQNAHPTKNQFYYLFKKIEAKENIRGAELQVSG